MMDLEKIISVTYKYYWPEIPYTVNLDDGTSIEIPCYAGDGQYHPERYRIYKYVSKWPRSFKYGTITITRPSANQ
jgi:hypothetical protein